MLMNNKFQIAIFAGGCFWCTEAIFRSLRGVANVTSGYAGGEMDKPSYEDVGSGATGHAEAVKIEFNPEEISYRDLLEVFFATHNPTTRNRQGADVGTQYRSVIFFVNDEQKEEAGLYIAELEEKKEFDVPIVTEVLPYKNFYTAEEYHQKYYESKPDAPYCQIVVSPKLAKLRQKFSRLVK